MLSHEKLDVYKISIEFLSLSIKIFDNIPKGNAHLIDQLKRASFSIPLNIAEGTGKTRRMDKSVCPKFEKCPIFTGESFVLEGSSQVYKDLFCSAGSEKYETCKRYIVSEKTGLPVPNNIMPTLLISKNFLTKRFANKQIITNTDC